jgi:hypothetical protein
LKKPEKTPDLRLFLGRSQWAPMQLENEMLEGAWYSMRAEGNLIFSASPQFLWRNLFERAEPAHGPIAKGYRYELQQAMEAPFAVLLTAPACLSRRSA